MGRFTLRDEGKDTWSKCLLVGPPAVGGEPHTNHCWLKTGKTVKGVPKASHFHRLILPLQVYNQLLQPERHGFIVRDFLEEKG